MIYDCIVIGLGGHGSAAVARISETQTVLGIEQFERNHGNGSSHGRSRIFRKAYFEDTKYVPLLLRSLALWRNLRDYEKEKKTANKSENYEPLFVEVGSMMIGTKESNIIQGTLKSIKDFNLDHEILSAEDIRRKYPPFNPSDNEIGVFESGAGYLVPESCIDVYLDIAQSNGAELNFNEKFVDWKEIDNHIEIRTSKGVYISKKLVLAVGPWAPKIYGSDIALPLKVERRVLFWMKPLEGLELFKNIPVYIWEYDNGDNFYGFPYQGGEPGPAVKVAFHIQDNVEGNACTPDDIDREIHPNEVEEIRKLLRPCIPWLNGELLTAATCMYTLTPDKHFLIDFHPKSQNVILASPCSGHGFKFCSVIGEIIAELVSTGKTQHDIAMFRINADRA